MTEKELFIQKMKARTKQFTLDVIAFCLQLPKNHVGYRTGDQLLRPGTSVGANYRALCRAPSGLSFTVKYRL